ncbi:hypothetical protein [Dictyobacter arantiisoli]|uniref:CHAT domain-containing protein n=1 Tax=Dictyobacter arantiisoli TaxID=2014874 RepID=A0A5A5TEU8_9CHLR|nr:hypothetical protein [Dictyobacter arantiisoli]GCF09603.1 hypothetical protein KDI_31670 [Dictyobacter arantiisoli]
MPMNLIQRMLANKSSRHPDQRPPTALQTREKIWFDMYVTKNGEQINNTICREGITYCKVDAGETYTLVALGSNIPSHFHTNSMGLEFTTEIKVRIQCIADTQILIEEERTITGTEANNYRQEFALSIDAMLPTCELVLRMDVVVAKDAVRTIGTKKLFIKGTYEVIHPQILHECQIATRLPDNVSILSILPHPDPAYQFGFTVQGWNSGQNLPTLQYPNRKPVSIQQYRQEGTDFMDIRVNIRNLSHYLKNYEHKKLPIWLTWLEKSYHEECYLIIEDESALEIPWEMLELQGDYRYLGVEFKVARWISRSVQAIPMNLAVNTSTHQGSVISYLDSMLKEEETKAERAILQHFLLEECSDLNSLNQRFKKDGNLTNIGLIYIGSHGEAGNKLHMASQQVFPAGRLKLMDEHAYPRPLAFFNACESARLGLIGTFDNNSFVTTLLERIVQGYIGTLAEVGSKRASAIAYSLLSTAQRNPDLPIAAILQQIRKEAAQRLRQTYENLSDDDPKEKAAEQAFIYTFLYVYYGNPLASLRLTPREETSCNNN